MYLLILIITVVIVATGVVIVFLPSDSADYKKCQHCGKSVKIETVVCKYCKKDLVDLPY